MKKKLIRDKTFNTFCELVWDCSEMEFYLYAKKKDGDFNISVNNSAGKFFWCGSKNNMSVVIWLKRKDNMETLTHETLHLVKFWLKDFYGIPLNDDTEEIYAMLHSFYFHECAKVLGLKKYIL